MNAKPNNDPNAGFLFSDNQVVIGGVTSLWRSSFCGVKELIMFIARANAAITQTMYQMIYPSESNSERFNLFLCHVFAMYQRCSISALFE